MFQKAITFTSIFVLAIPLFLLAESSVIKGAQEIHLVKKDVSRPLRELPPAARAAGVKRIRPNHRFTSNFPFRPDGALQTSAAPSLNAPSATGDFEGIGEGIPNYTVNWVPPDTNGDVGLSHYVQSVNTEYAVFNKSTGAIVLGPIPINTIWNGFGGGCENNNDGDPIVTYDQFSDRWIVSQFSVARKPYLECVAVSTGGDPTGSYHRYAYSFGNRDFPDYPKVGVWPTEDAYFITYNIFQAFFAGPRVCAYQRSKLMAGQTNTAQCFNPSSSYHSLLPADLDGSTLPAAGTDGYFIALKPGQTSSLASWRVNMDWANAANSTFTGPATVSGVADYSDACGGGNCIPQSGTSNTLDSLGERLMHRAAYRVFADHEALVANHSVTAAGSVGVRWYELRPSGNGLTTFQQGTYSPDSTYRWMGSIAMDQAGNIGVGYSASSGSINPGIRYTGRLAGDPIGVLQAESTIISGTGSQTTYDRWGDYSSIQPDPVDDCTFWYTTEYLTQTNVFNWHTRIASFKFSTCGGGGGGNNPPAASFTFTCDGLTCNFTDTSTDPDGNLDTRDWDFGDGGSDTIATPTHAYASAGTFQVELIVTDTEGVSDTATQNVTVYNINLSTNGYKVKGTQTVDLTWSGASSANVDIYRGSVKITTENDGFYTDNIGAKGRGSYSYQVCEAGTSICSNTSVVEF